MCSLKWYIQFKLAYIRLDCILIFFLGEWDQKYLQKGKTFIGFVVFNFGRSQQEVPENKRRVSIVKGIVIARRNAGLNSTFRIRRLVA